MKYIFSTDSFEIRRKLEFFIVLAFLGLDKYQLVLKISVKMLCTGGPSLALKRNALKLP